MHIALPPAQTALRFSDVDRQWVITGYALAFGSLLLFGAAGAIACGTLLRSGPLAGQARPLRRAPGLRSPRQRRQHEPDGYQSSGQRRTGPAGWVTLPAARNRVSVAL
jgi:hypothetical protein